MPRPDAYPFEKDSDENLRPEPEETLVNHSPVDEDPDLEDEDIDEPYYWEENR